MKGPVTDSDVVLILGSNRLKVEVDELMLPKGFNKYFVEICELPQKREIEQILKIERMQLEGEKSQII